MRHAKPSGGVSEAWMASFPPVGGGAAAPRGGVAAKVQTHWTKVAENGLFLPNGSALWRICCLSWRVVRTRTRYCEPKPAISHANPLLRAWAGLPMLVLAGYVRIRGPMCGLEGPRARCRAHMQTIGPACVFVGVHVAVLLRMDFSCCGGSDHAGNGGSWAPLLAVLTLQCGAKPT